MEQCLFSLPVPPSLDAFGTDDAKKKAWLSLDISVLIFYSHLSKTGRFKFEALLQLASGL